MHRTLLTRRSVLRTASAGLLTPLLPGIRARASGLPKVIFDSMGAQVQVQKQTEHRLTTWVNALGELYNVSFTDYQQPIAPQLEDQDVFIITTHQYVLAPDDIRKHNFIPDYVNFAYSKEDLKGIFRWVQAGGGLLLFTNHTNQKGVSDDYPYWPIYDIQLAAALGITLVFAYIVTGDGSVPMEMRTSTQAPLKIGRGSLISSYDSGGIVATPGAKIIRSYRVLVPLPPTLADGSRGWKDIGPSEYTDHPNDLSLGFAVLYDYGLGARVIVIGHSGIAGDADSTFPSPGEIGTGDNKQFLMNCVDYLASGS